MISNIGKSYRATAIMVDGTAKRTHEITAGAVLDFLDKIPAKSVSKLILRRLDHDRRCANTIQASDLTVDAWRESLS